MVSRVLTPRLLGGNQWLLYTWAPDHQAVSLLLNSLGIVSRISMRRRKASIACVEVLGKYCRITGDSVNIENNKHPNSEGGKREQQK